MSDAVFEIRDLVKKFGELKAVDQHVHSASHTGNLAIHLRAVLILHGVATL